MKYQKPLQGIRAFAVLIVVLNHLGINGFSGGFIGVDIFFVISGYLITGLLVEEYCQNGNISTYEFYSRRLKRILPALIVTVVVTSLAGFLLLSEERLSLLIDSALASLFSVSNIYFWSQIGYFDTEVIEKPLLHTWSLGVEEQFYLIWPVLIILLAKLGSKKRITYGVSALSLASFFLSMYVFGWGMPESLYSGDGFRTWFENDASTVFYLMPFRVFEFGIGAVLGVICFKEQSKISARLSDFLFLISAFVLVLATGWLNKNSIFPFHNALVVSAAAALAIYSSFNSRLASLVLANKTMVFIGSVSYSLYLVHWPVISYYSMLFGFPSFVESIGLFFAMFMLAWVMFRLVEQPMRKMSFLSSFDKEFSKSIPKVLVVIGMIGIAFLLNGMKGVDWRIPESRKTLKNSEWRALERKTYCQDKINGFPGEIFTCQNDRGAEKTVVAWGDSHAQHLVSGLSEIYPDHNIAISYVSACIPQSGFNGLVRSLHTESKTQNCIDRNHAFLEWADSYQGELLIFITSAKRNTPKKISEINDMLISRIEKPRHEVLVLGDFIRPGNQIAQCRSVPDFVLSDKNLKAICGPDENAVSSEIAYSEKMAKLSEKYVPVHESQCYKNECRFSDEEGRATYRDHHHLSVYGAIYEMKKASELIFKYAEGSL